MATIWFDQPHDAVTDGRREWLLAAPLEASVGALIAASLILHLLNLASRFFGFPALGTADPAWSQFGQALVGCMAFLGAAAGLPRELHPAPASWRVEPPSALRHGIAWVADLGLAGVLLTLLRILPTLLDVPVSSFSPIVIGAALGAVGLMLLYLAQAAIWRHGSTGLLSALAVAALVLLYGNPAWLPQPWVFAVIAVVVACQILDGRPVAFMLLLPILAWAGASPARLHAAILHFALDVGADQLSAIFFFTLAASLMRRGLQSRAEVAFGSGSDALGRSALAVIAGGLLLGLSGGGRQRRSPARPAAEASATAFAERPQAVVLAAVAGTMAILLPGSGVLAAAGTLADISLAQLFMAAAVPAVVASVTLLAVGWLVGGIGDLRRRHHARTEGIVGLALSGLGGVTGTATNIAILGILAAIGIPAYMSHRAGVGGDDLALLAAMIAAAIAVAVLAIAWRRFVVWRLERGAAAAVPLQGVWTVLILLAAFVIGASSYRSYLAKAGGHLEPADYWSVMVLAGAIALTLVWYRLRSYSAPPPEKSGSAPFLPLIFTALGLGLLILVSVEPLLRRLGPGVNPIQWFAVPPVVAILLALPALLVFRHRGIGAAQRYGIVALPALAGIPIISLGGLFVGLLTPAESGAVAALLALIFAGGTGGLIGRFRALVEAAASAGSLVFLVAAVGLLAAAARNFAFGSGILQALNLVADAGMPLPLVTAIIIAVAGMVAGALLGAVGGFLVLLALCLPNALQLGIGPEFVTILLLQAAVLGAMLPWVGAGFRFACSDGDIAAMATAPWAAAYVCAIGISLAMTIAWPELVYALPDSLYSP